MATPPTYLITIPLHDTLDGDGFVAGYADPLILEALSMALDGPVTDQQVLDLASAIEDFGGVLTTAQHTKVERALARTRCGG